MTSPATNPRWLHAALLVCATAPLALAQQGAAPPPAPAPSPAKDAPAPVAKPSGEPLPDLDEMLGLPGSKKPGAEKPADAKKFDANKSELDRRLSAKEIDDNFKQAVQLMSDVAQRLEQGSDYGADTQRTQEEIIRRLDAIIAAAKERQQKSSSSSSQSKSSQSKEQQEQKPGSQQSKQQQAGGKDNNAELTPPGGRTGALNKDALDAAIAAWGALPDRVRDSLLQGMGDRFSSLYDSLTQEYYRRLAEEKPKE